MTAIPSTLLSFDWTRSNYQSTLTQQLEALSLGKETLRAEDLREIGDLGSGNGGSVKKVTHIPTGTTMAKKVRFISLHSYLFVVSGVKVDGISLRNPPFWWSEANLLASVLFASIILNCQARGRQNRCHSLWIVEAGSQVSEKITQANS